MLYDTLYRHNQALAEDAAAAVGIALHALTAAIEDCRRAGKAVERDAAILLLMRALGDSATRAAPDLDALRARCAADRAAIIASPALLAIAGHSVGDLPVAKRTFHAEARRALLRLAEALGFEEPDVRIVAMPGATHDDGVTELRHPDLTVRIVPRSFLPDTEVSFFRCSNGQPAGRPFHAPARDLLDPGRFARRIAAATALPAAPLPVAA